MAEGHSYLLVIPLVQIMVLLELDLGVAAGLAEVLPMVLMLVKDMGLAAVVLSAPVAEPLELLAL